MNSPSTIESAAKRKDGVLPNFELEHVCAQCERRYLCPDRYLAARCEAMAYCEKMGWVPYSWTCTPCILKLSTLDEDRAIYCEAHGVYDAQPKERAA